MVDINKAYEHQPPPLDHPLSHRGRFARLAYLAWYLVISLVFLVAIILAFVVVGSVAHSELSTDAIGATGLLVFAVIYVIFFYYAVVITIRRLHDLNQSGWLSILMFVPLINLFFMLYVMCAKGTPTQNSFGMPRPNKSWENTMGIIYIVLASLIMIAGIILVMWGFGMPNEALNNIGTEMSRTY